MLYIFMCENVCFVNIMSHCVCLSTPSDIVGIVSEQVVHGLQFVTEFAKLENVLSGMWHSYKICCWWCKYMYVTLCAKLLNLVLFAVVTANFFLDISHYLDTLCIVNSVIFVTKIKTRTRIIGRRFQRTRTRIIVIQKTKTK